MIHLVAKIILPLPLKQTYSYLADNLSGKIQIGMRAIVSFGARRFYTGIVHEIEQQENVENLKEIHALLDEGPILHPQQLELWKWMADYYQCSLGEVMKAALPAAFRMESETYVTKCETTEQQNLTEKEQSLLALLEDKPSSIEKLSKNTSFKNIFQTLKSLQKRGLIVLSEEIVANYRPKTLTCVRLNKKYTEKAQQDNILQSLHRSPKQQQLLSAIIDLSTPSATSPVEISKKELLSYCKVNDAVFNELRKKGFIECYQKEIARIIDIPASQPLHPLNTYQIEAYNDIRSQFREKNVVLLHGVTSSGKTEIYMHLIEDTLKQGKQVLYLVPEIALTTQLAIRLKKVFGEKIGIYHSRYTDNERMETWLNLLQAKNYRIILGARSSVFLPFNNLGLVIVDEEHDASFKQYDPSPRYNARNTAIILATQHHAKVLLGSATPSIESYTNAKLGKYGIVKITHRYEDIQMPHIEIVDLQKCYHMHTMQGHFTPQLIERIHTTLNNGEQVILFQNRRGYAPYVECKQCAWVPKCPNCDVSLTYHQKFNKLSCHYCGYSTPLPAKCPECKQSDIETKGFGTEQVETEVKQLFPQATAIRMDLDTTSTKSAYENIISAFERQDAQILIGTQIVTKGLDFGHVGLVGILNADNLLNHPDFRAHERAYQLLTQVSGRAGRKGKQGIVVVQTSSPSHPIIQLVNSGIYDDFYSSQISERQAFSYPPYFRLTSIEIKHKNATILTNAANQLAQQLRHANIGIILGPSNPPVSKIQNYFIKQIMIKIPYTSHHNQVKKLISQTIDGIMTQGANKQLRINFDVDPM